MSNVLGVLADKFLNLQQNHNPQLPFVLHKGANCMIADCLLSLITTAKCLPREFCAGAWQGLSEAALAHLLLHWKTGKLSTRGSWQHTSLATPSSATQRLEKQSKGSRVASALS